MRMYAGKISSFFIHVLLLFIECSSCYSGGDNLSAGHTLKYGHTILSKDGIFVLGLFTKGTPLKLYLGIWYKQNVEQQVIVRVANREKPLPNLSSSRLEISTDGNLVLLSESETVWSTNLILPIPNSVEAVLLDSGNFILRDGVRPSIIFWQSFDHPTDTWLPGAKLGINRLTGQNLFLTSWKNPKDPASGMFSFKIDPVARNQFFIEWNMSRRYWSSGKWTNGYFSSSPKMSFTNYFQATSNENETYYTFSLFQKNILSRIVMNTMGRIQQLTCLRDHCSWTEIFHEPEHSEVYAACGAFGMSNENRQNSCACLPGFEPSPYVDTRSNDNSVGCVKKIRLHCDDNSLANGEKEEFRRIPNVEFPDNPKAYPKFNAQECQNACFKSCSCLAYIYNESICSTWDGGLLNLRERFDDSKIGQDLYLRFAASELKNDGGKTKMLLMKIIVPVSLVLLISGSLVCYFFIRKLKEKGGKSLYEDLLSFDFYDSIQTTNDETSTVNDGRKGKKKNADLPFFSFASVSAATGDFSETNKIGEGGFGPVYKGKSMNGQEIAVKRLSKRSGQGVEEFRNEVALIARLQHRNLVRLLGCCSEKDENILIYEYLPNKSLDFFLFDPNRRQILDWEKRIRIIEGIAQGLLYLHQYSRLCIIHRDLKASNILLDSQMNPRISDFGMARIFQGNELQAITKRIVGTYGYMAPEYALEGLFSIKSDVFSFGVSLLEIVSGKKNTGFYNSDSFNLLGHAWCLWNADQALELLDKSLSHPPCSSIFLRYINIGLLCVQDHPNDRPAMPIVVSMLSNEVISLPEPKQPAFCNDRNRINTKFLMGSSERCSINGITVSVIQPR